MAQQRDRRVEQAIDDVHVEAAVDEELDPQLGGIDRAGEPDKRQQAGERQPLVSRHHGQDSDD